MIVDIKDQYNFQIQAKYRNQSKNTCRKAVENYEKSLSKDVKSIPKGIFRFSAILVKP